MASYAAAIENRRTPDTARFRSVVVLYKASKVTDLSPSTNGSGRRGSTASPTTSANSASRSSIGRRRSAGHRRWRNRWADTPRTADYGMQVLSRVLSYAVDPLGKIAGNPCEGIKQLYSGDRSRDHLDRRRHRAASKKTLLDRDRARGRSRGAHRAAPRRSVAAVLVARRRGRDRHHDRQEQGPPRGDHSALR